MTARSDRGGVQLVALARRELELCRVRPEETVLLYTDADSRPDVTAALFGAAVTASEQAFEVVAPSVRQSRRSALPSAVLELAPSIDLMIDASSRGMLHGGAIARVQSGGARILRVREPASVLARLFPDEGVCERVEQGARLLRPAREVRVTSAAGSDLRIARGERPVLRQHGFAAERGDWDHWGTALTTYSPPEHEADGVLVLAPGDIFFLTAVIGVYVRDPIRLTIADGAITDVEGGADARRLQRLLRAVDDRQAARISHVGWGADPRADWEALLLHAGDGGGGADVRSFYGGVVIAFGSNVDMGGSNTTRFHMDLAFREVDVALDGRALIEKGEFVPSEMR